MALATASSMEVVVGHGRRIGPRQFEDVEGWRPGNGHRTSIGGCDRELVQPGSARFCAVSDRDSDYLRHSRSGPDAKAASRRITPGSRSHRTSQYASQRERHQYDAAARGPREPVAAPVREKEGTSSRVAQI